MTMKQITGKLNGMKVNCGMEISVDGIKLGKRKDPEKPKDIVLKCFPFYLFYKQHAPI